MRIRKDVSDLLRSHVPVSSVDLVYRNGKLVLSADIEVYGHTFYTELTLDNDNMIIDIWLHDKDLDKLVKATSDVVTVWDAVNREEMENRVLRIKWHVDVSDIVKSIVGEVLSVLAGALAPTAWVDQNWLDVMYIVRRDVLYGILLQDIPGDEWELLEIGDHPITDEIIDYFQEIVLS